MTTGWQGLNTLDGNAQKVPLGPSLLRLSKAAGMDAVATLGKSLPCKVVSVTSPWIVTVSFEVQTGQPWTLPQVTMPVLAPPYISYPIKAGDAGLAIAAAARLGGLSGLGTGVPNLQDTPGNLSSLAFVWLGNTSQTTLDSEAVVIWNNIVASQDELAFFGGAKVAKQDVIGALSAVTDPDAKAVLTSLIAALAAYGLVTNGTT